MTLLTPVRILGHKQSIKVPTQVFFAVQLHCRKENQVLFYKNSNDSEQTATMWLFFFFYDNQM